MHREMSNEDKLRPSRTDALMIIAGAGVQYFTLD